MRILVVEDDERVSANVRTGLERSGFDVDVSGNGNEAFVAASALDYDAIVLDVMLPGQDGIEVSRHLRASGKQTPILMLTALDEVAERVAGLDAGADDYLSKPFAMAELVARVKALVRRQLPGRNPCIEVGDLELDTAAHSLRTRGIAVVLTAKEYAILEFLMLNRGQVVTRTQVLEHAWGFELEGGDNLVEVLLGRIRRKIREAGGGNPVTTIRGAGYRFENEAT
jgi:DNA-binding response OmpR family regulator